MVARRVGDPARHQLDPTDQGTANRDGEREVTDPGVAAIVDRAPPRSDAVVSGVHRRERSACRADEATARGGAPNMRFVVLVDLSPGVLVADGFAKTLTAMTLRDRSRPDEHGMGLVHEITVETHH